MAGPLSVDPASPFFSSVSAQAARQLGAKKSQEQDSKAKLGVRRFDRILESEQTDKTPAENAGIPAHLAGLPAEKILEILLDDVHSAGDRLKDNQAPEQIIAYKQAVRHFVRFVVDRSYTVTESVSGGNILKRKKFIQVEVIDQKLEQLAAGILSGQRNQMALLARIEEINGLLIDLLS